MGFRAAPSRSPAVGPMSRRILLTLLASVGLALPASAQTQGDIDLLAQVYGTRPPQSYYALKARQPDAFQFRGAWFRRMPRAAAVGGGAAVPGAPAAVLGPRGSAVQGTFHFPLVIGLFADSPSNPPFTTEAI